MRVTIARLKVYFDFENRITQPAYFLLNATLAWIPPDSSFSVTLWARNLTDEAAISSTIESALYDAIDYTPPRMIGATLKYVF